jgi:hypothetical protein
MDADLFGQVLLELAPPGQQLNSFPDLHGVQTLG